MRERGWAKCTCLTGGVVFKCRHTRCTDELVRVCREAEQKKVDAEANETQNKSDKQTQRERRKHADKIDAIRKEVRMFSQRWDKYEAFTEKAKDKSRFRRTKKCGVAF